ncbi:MAG: bifunctional hydroxymethylpyrimidine kinase/phosphomethylpyrimidine kinase [Verrucomicrobia bacterium]|nr:bifunctional hydroxymethylpyrimidine kinase/phosphomethylpyrimidine kinase [Verrucomicrobiota bacterium]
MKRIPVALTIAGSDSGGGSGLQADLRTFTAFGVHGACAATCITAHNPERIAAAQGCPPALVRAQLEAVFEGLRPNAVKTGALWSRGIVETVAEFLEAPAARRTPLVVDPVTAATSGRRLARRDATEAMAALLFPRASLITPNLQEASALLGRPVADLKGMRAAAAELCARFGKAFVVKGGHLEGGQTVVDVFRDGELELLLRGRRVRGACLHGTGCAFSAAATAALALGLPLPEAVRLAKRWIGRAIAGSVRIGASQALGLFGGGFRPKPRKS